MQGENWRKANERKTLDGGSPLEKRGEGVYRAVGGGEKESGPGRNLIRPGGKGKAAPYRIEGKDYEERKKSYQRKKRGGTRGKKS